MKMSEYDAFGPWIYRIDEEHEIPRCFRPHVDEDDGALFRLKVPKQIERRDATPDMDLYDYLLNVYEDRLELLHLADEGVWMKKVKYNKICAISHYKDVLLGRLTIYLTDDTFKFEYNAVSEDMIMDVVSEIRKRYTAKVTQKEEGANFDVSKIKPEDLFFVNRWSQIQKEESPFVNCVYQPPRLLTDESGAKPRKKNGPSNLGGSLHMKKADEWIILQRIAEYDYEYLFMPRSNLVQITPGGDSPYTGIKKISITAGSLSKELMYGADNAAIEALYR